MYNVYSPLFELMVSFELTGDLFNFKLRTNCHCNLNFYSLNNDASTFETNEKLHFYHFSIEIKNNVFALFPNQLPMIIIITMNNERNDDDEFVVCRRLINYYIWNEVIYYFFSFFHRKLESRTGKSSFYSKAMHLMVLLNTKMKLQFFATKIFHYNCNLKFLRLIWRESVIEGLTIHYSYTWTSCHFQINVSSITINFQRCWANSLCMFSSNCGPWFKWHLHH